MKICVTSEGPTLDSKVETRFGRGRYFIFVDPDTMNYEAVENPSINAMGGAGIQAAQLIAQNGAEVVITGGNFGPNAAQALSSFGIQMIGGFSGTVREAIEKFKRGELGEATFSGGPSGVSETQIPPDYEGVEPHEIKKEAVRVAENIKRAKEKADKLIERK